MRTATIQPMRVTLRDGRVEVACCGPAVLRLDAAAYLPDGEARRGVCCHTGAARAEGMFQVAAEARDTNAVYRALGAMLGDRR